MYKILLNEVANNENFEKTYICWTVGVAKTPSNTVLSI